MASPPPLLNHDKLTRPSSHDISRQGLLSSKNAVLIALPLTIILIFSASFCLLIKLRRRKSRKSINSSGCSLFKESFDSIGIPAFSIGEKHNAIAYSPDVGNCIYAGKFASPLQAGPRRGQVFTYRELELATGGFNEKNAIGSDGLGVVYGGILSDGSASAIKLLQNGGNRGERDFRAEVDLLSRLHSKYLVSLLGYCADQHHRLLAFEYMSNGSLQDHLHPTSTTNTRHRTPLDWKTRLGIALDCARGLEFLHEQTVPSIIHRDLKCSNILLDNHYRAKVSDFGMAKVGSDKPNGALLTRVRGTTGYLAPEYASTGTLTTKSDVYSYGVVLLELLTGRVPVDPTRPPGEHVLVQWALPRLTNRDKVVEMVDPAMQGQFSKKDLIQIAAIAAVCVQSEADYRPLMTDVVQSLIPLVRNSVSASPSTPSRFKVSTPEV